ncbi:MAG: type I-C CRISPR-associated protein Cas5c, partial [Chthoniobacterales bacterium]
MNNTFNETENAKVDLVVWGDYACFTRPEFKSERESYQVITPAAARGILEAIYWKPQMRYRILEIHIHSLGRRFSLLRNELASRQSVSANKGEHRLMIDEDRQQRTSLILKDVAYRIRAWIDIRADEPNEKIGKHLDSCLRRVRAGTYHHRPTLGCREFPAHFAAYGNSEIPEKYRECNTNLNDHLGTMLFDTAYIKSGSFHQSSDEMTFYHHQ